MGYTSQWRKTQTTFQSMKRSRSSTWTSSTDHDGTHHTRNQAIQERRKSVARIKTPQATIWNKEACTQTRRALQDRRSSIPPQLPTQVTETMENPPRLPCHSLIALSWKRYPRKEFPYATSWLSQWRTRIQSWNHCDSQASRMKEPIFG